MKIAKNITYVYDLTGLTEKDMFILEKSLELLISKWQDEGNLIPANKMLSEIRTIVSCHKI
jgi:hypothetical protein